MPARMSNSRQRIVLRVKIYHLPTRSGDRFEGGGQLVGMAGDGYFWERVGVGGWEGFEEGADGVVGEVFVVCCFGVGVDVMI